MPITQTPCVFGSIVMHMLADKIDECENYRPRCGAFIDIVFWLCLAIGNVCLILTDVAAWFEQAVDGIFYFVIHVFFT